LSRFHHISQELGGKGICFAQTFLHALTQIESGAYSKPPNLSRHPFHLQVTTRVFMGFAWFICALDLIWFFE
jgi:hypothetical protein